MRDPVMSDPAKGAGVKSTTKSSTIIPQARQYYIQLHLSSLLRSPCGLSSLQVLCGHCLMGIWESQWGRSDPVPWMINADPDIAISIGPRFLEGGHKSPFHPERLSIIPNSITRQSPPSCIVLCLSLSAWAWFFLRTRGQPERTQPLSSAWWSLRWLNTLEVRDCQHPTKLISIAPHCAEPQKIWKGQRASYNIVRKQYGRG